MEWPHDDLHYETTLRVGADHPSLAGHFPGRPIVPGVVLLDQVIAAAERWLGRRLHVVSLPQAKFLAPLPPDETVHVRLQLAEARLRFTLVRDGRTIARGMFELAQPSGGDRE